MYYYKGYDPHSMQNFERTFEDKHEAIDFARNHVFKYPQYTVKDEGGKIIDSDDETQKTLQSLLLKYPGSIPAIYELAAPYCPGGTKNVKAIYLGSHSINRHSDPLISIFNRGIKSHEEQLRQVDLNWDNVYALNLCKNYFCKGTSAYSKFWAQVADEYWIKNLKDELEEIFEPCIPVLMTVEPIYEILLNPDQLIQEPVKFYNCTAPIPIPATHNKLNRLLIPMYSHAAYKLSLDKWKNYRNRIKKIIHEDCYLIKSKKA